MTDATPCGDGAASPTCITVMTLGVFRSKIAAALENVHGGRNQAPQVVIVTKNGKPFVRIETAPDREDAGCTDRDSRPVTSVTMTISSLRAALSVTFGRVHYGRKEGPVEVHVIKDGRLYVRLITAKEHTD